LYDIIRLALSKILEIEEGIAAVDDFSLDKGFVKLPVMQADMALDKIKHISTG
jgi:hypothetical protein